MDFEFTPAKFRNIACRQTINGAVEWRGFGKPHHLNAFTGEPTCRYANHEVAAIDADNGSGFHQVFGTEIDCLDRLEFPFGGVNRLLETFGKIGLKLRLGLFVQFDWLGRNQFGALQELKIVMGGVLQFLGCEVPQAFPDAFFVHCPTFFRRARHPGNPDFQRLSLKTV